MTKDLRKMQDPVCVALENEIEATNKLASNELRLKALADLERRSKEEGCEGAFLLVHYELLGIYMDEGEEEQVARVQAVIKELSPKVIARAEQEQGKTKPKTKD